MTDITPTVAAVPTSAETARAHVVSQTSSRSPTTTVPVTWHTPTSSRWVAYRDATRIGSIDHVGAFIVTNQHMDVLGAFVDLADAQLAIVDPQPADADMVRRTRAHRLRREARLRQAALIALSTVFVMLAIGAVVLFVSVRR